MNEGAQEAQQAKQVERFECGCTPGNALHGHLDSCALDAIWARQRQRWYRNYAVEIAPGRFDRSHWRPELEREPLERVHRSTEGRRPDGRHIVPKAEAKRPGPPSKYTPENLPEWRALYRFVRVERVPKTFTPRVVARCTGPHCGGKERNFTLIAWAEGTPKLRGCSKCVGVMRRAERAAAREALEAGRVRKSRSALS